MLEELQENQLRFVIIILIAGGGLFSFIGLTLPYLTIFYSESVSLTFDGFNLYYTESIPQIIGSLIAMISSGMIYYYTGSTSHNEEEVNKQYSRMVLFLIISIICSVIGLFFFLIDILDSILKIWQQNLDSSLNPRIGFYLSLIGPILVTIGTYFTIKFKKKIFHLIIVEEEPSD